MIKKKYNVITNKHFKIKLQKLSNKHQLLVLKKLHLLACNPFHPSFRTKKIKGAFDDRFESSVNMDIRIFWRFEDEKIILVISVGHHDILKEY